MTTSAIMVGLGRRAPIELASELVAAPLDPAMLTSRCHLRSLIGVDDMHGQLPAVHPLRQRPPSHAKASRSAVHVAPASRSASSRKVAFSISGSDPEACLKTQSRSSVGKLVRVTRNSGDRVVDVLLHDVPELVPAVAQRRDGDGPDAERHGLGGVPCTDDELHACVWVLDRILDVRESRGSLLLQMHNDPDLAACSASAPLW
jgi:hypothetical protein